LCVLNVVCFGLKVDGANLIKVIVVSLEAMIYDWSFWKKIVGVDSFFKRLISKGA
jgi:hypothetical protein